MDEIGSLIQGGGAEIMGMLNQRGGVVQHIIPQIVWIAVPIVFFAVYYFWHLGLDDERAEIKKDDKGYEYRDYIIWGKFSLKVLLTMIALCVLFAHFFGWILLKLPKELNPGQKLTGYYWTAMFYLMIASGVITIVFGGLKSTAYQYFVDDLHDDKDKMKQVCVEFGCGYAPHGESPVTRGENI